MRDLWFLIFICFMAVEFVGCNTQDNHEEVELYTTNMARSQVKLEVYPDDELSQKKRAQELTLGGKREDGLHYIDYSAPNYMDIVVFTKRAQDHLKRNGIRKALEDFMNPDSPFVAGRMYVFAYSLEGECLADWAEPKKIGQRGDSEFMRAASQAAALGGGWVDSVEVDPLERARRNKESYVVFAEGDVLIGAGLYKN